MLYLKHAHLPVPWCEARASSQHRSTHGVICFRETPWNESARVSGFGLSNGPGNQGVFKKPLRQALWLPAVLLPLTCERDFPKLPAWFSASNSLMLLCLLCVPKCVKFMCTNACAGPEVDIWCPFQSLPTFLFLFLFLSLFFCPLLSLYVCRERQKTERQTDTDTHTHIIHAVSCGLE